MADDGYVTVHRTTDVAQGELLAETLRSEGIDARFHHVSSALIGLPPAMIEMTVDVPVKSEARARELLRDLEYLGAAAAAKVEGADDESAADEQRPRAGRTPILAVGFAVLLPGGGHLYARRAWTTLVIALGVVGCLTVVIITDNALVGEGAISIWIALAACDAIAGFRATRAHERGERRDRGGQITSGVGLVVLAILIGVGIRLATAAPRAWRHWQLAKFAVSCNDGKITVHNRDDRPHTVEISKIRVGAASFFAPDQVYDVGPVGPKRMALAAGGRGVLTVVISEWLADTCGFTRAVVEKKERGLLGELRTPRLGSVPLHRDCGFVFDFSPELADGESIDAYGTCVPHGAVADGKLRLRR